MLSAPGEQLLPPVDVNDSNEEFVLATGPVVVEELLQSNELSTANSSQGIELEFVCGGKTNVKGPTISSPVKLANVTETSQNVALDTNHESVIEDDTMTIVIDGPENEPVSVGSIDFHGFEPSDINGDKLATFVQCMENQLFLENNQLLMPNAKLKRRMTSQTPVSTKKPRTNETETATIHERNIKMNFSLKNPELFLAKVIISKSDARNHMKLKDGHSDVLSNDEMIGMLAS